MLKLLIIISLGIVTTSLSGCAKSYEDVERLQQYCSKHDLQSKLIANDGYVLDVVCIGPDGSRYPSKFTN